MKVPRSFFTLILVGQAIPAALSRRTGAGGSGGTEGTPGGTGDTTGNTDTTGTGNGLDAIPVAHSPGKDYSLGEYTSDRHTPFEQKEGEWKAYYSRVDNILKATPTKTTVIAKYHYHNGNGATAVVDQSLATSACNAWSTLSVYCGGAGTSCACYSGTYYVPDQWNTLAGYCAQAVVTVATTEASSTVTSASDSMFPFESTLLDLARSASSYTTYCPTTGKPTVAFGAMAPTDTSTTSSTTRTSAGSTIITTADLFKWKILALLFSVLLFGYVDLC